MKLQGAVVFCFGVFHVIYRCVKVDGHPEFNDVGPWVQVDGDFESYSDAEKFMWNCLKVAETV